MELKYDMDNDYFYKILFFCINIIQFKICEFYKYNPLILAHINFANHLRDM